jgi:hypothetical protein
MDRSAGVFSVILGIYRRGSLLAKAARVGNISEIAGVFDLLKPARFFSRDGSRIRNYSAPPHAHFRADEKQERERNGYVGGRGPRIRFSANIAYIGQTPFAKAFQDGNGPAGLGFFDGEFGFGRIWLSPHSKRFSLHLSHFL